MSFTIVVPVLNEQQILPEFLERLSQSVSPVQAQSLESWEIILVDAGSSDESPKLLRAAAATHGWRYVESRAAAPSVGSTVEAGVNAASGQVVLVLPCDCFISAEALLALNRAWLGGATCGGFPKTYVPDLPVLRVYATLQNWLRFRLLKQVVWTHGIYFDRDCIAGLQFPTQGFLEDVILSDHLKHQRGWAAISMPIEVSARRYYPNRVFRRIAVNALILMLFRSGAATPERLRAFYRPAR